MAAKRKSNKKESHGERTHSALKSLNIGSSELNASLLNPKITPPPRSNFSALFRTKGNRANINQDVLIEPNKLMEEYQTPKPEYTKVPSVKDYGGEDVGGKTKWKDKQKKQEYDAAVAEVNAINAAADAQYTADVQAAQASLTADTTAFDAAKGSRTSRGKTKGITRGSRGRNGVL